MDHFQGITAEIISNGQLLKSYNDPDAAEIEDSHARHQYVEALGSYIPSHYLYSIHMGAPKHWLGTPVLPLESMVLTWRNTKLGPLSR